MRGVFVTGTGTEVGKTVVAAVIAQALARCGQRVGVFKPALTGLDQPGEPDHALLRRAAGSGQDDDEIAPYRFGPPMSPHLAGRLGGRPIDRDRLLEAARSAGRDRTLVAEGVGGLLVPLAGDYLARDLARDLGLPIVVAASPGLGTINHTLLTLEAARTAGLEVSAVVLTPWPAEPGEIELDNRRTIAGIGQVDVVTLERIDLERPQTWPELRVPGV